MFEDVFAAHDSSTLEQLKELSSKRRVIEETINETSTITEAIAREIFGGLTSQSLQVKLFSCLTIVKKNIPIWHHFQIAFYFILFFVLEVLNPDSYLLFFWILMIIKCMVLGINCSMIIQHLV